MVHKIEFLEDGSAQAFSIENKTDTLHEVEPGCLSRFLEYSVIFQEGFTYGDLFTYIKEEKKFFETVFFKSLKGLELQPWLDELNIAKQKNSKEQEIDALCVYWRADEDYLDEYSLDSMCTGINNKTGEEYAIFTMELQKLRDLSIQLDQHLIIYDPESFNDVKFTHSNVPFTLFDVLSAVFFEMACCGHPREREQWIEELNARIDEVHEEIDAN